MEESYRPLSLYLSKASRSLQENRRTLPLNILTIPLRCKSHTGLSAYLGIFSCFPGQPAPSAPQHHFTHFLLSLNIVHWLPILLGHVAAFFIEKRKPAAGNAGQLPAVILHNLWNAAEMAGARYKAEAQDHWVQISDL